MVLTIDGFDMLPYIAPEGLKWQVDDIDGENAGRAQNAGMIFDYRGTKRRLDITCRPMTGSELATVLQKVRGVVKRSGAWQKPRRVVSVTYTDPERNETVTADFYANNIPVQFKVKRTNGVEMWAGLVFPLIEV